MSTVNPDIEKLTEQWAPALRKAFLDALALLSDRVQVGAVAAALARGDVDAALRAVGLDPVLFRGLDEAVAQTYAAGGTSVLARVPPVPQPEGHKLSILFDVRNPQAEAWLRTHSSELVREIVDDQREVVRQHLTRGLEQGRNPKSVALDLIGRINPTTRKREGGVLGLTASQEAWSARYADELANLNPAALNRKLRDRRFDGALRKAIKSGQPLSPDLLSKMVAAYRGRALKHRAETLARTEAMAALNQSQADATEQAIAKGAVKEKYVTKTWKSGVDVRVRHSHRVLHNQTVPFRGRFRAESGEQLRFPGDPDASAAERVNCRCHMLIKIDFIRQALDGGA